MSRWLPSSLAARGFLALWGPCPPPPGAPDGDDDDDDSDSDGDNGGDDDDDSALTHVRNYGELRI
eukprot:6532477-Pyramimonas_sp.AAC.1